MHRYFSSEAPEKTICVTLDLECDYGTILQSNRYESAKNIHKLIQPLEEFGIPLSVFLQTEILQECPKAVLELERSDIPVEFHAHSHTHPRRKNADIEYEVEKSISMVRDRFNCKTVGYRFPDGDMYANDYEILDKYDADFSASIFPSWRPGKYLNIKSPQYPHVELESDIVEIPFTVYSSLMPIPTSLSYVKLLGKVYELTLYDRPPGYMIYNIHMHDIHVPKVYNQLPKPYRYVFRRNKNKGQNMIDSFLRSTKSKNYNFELVSDVYNTVRNQS